MDFLSILPNISLIASIVMIILFVKRIVSDERKRLVLGPVPGWIWILSAFIGGIIAALIINLAVGFKDFNFFVFLKDAFIHAAGAAFIYDTGKLILPDKPAAGV